MTTATNAIIKARPSAYAFINPKSIVRKPGHNPRFEFGEIAELARSIVENGMLMAIRVKKLNDGTFELVDGDRRLTAVELLIKEGRGEQILIEGIPAVMVDKDQDEVTGLIQMFEANTGKPFLPLEEAAAFKAMRDAGMTIEQIAQKVQRAHMHVINTLALIDAAPELQAAVAKGEVKATQAKRIAVVARGDKRKQAELAKKAAEANKSGDRKARAKVDDEIEQQRVAKAEAKGKTVKMRALSDDALSEKGARLAKHFESLLKEAKIDPATFDLRKWVEEDEKLAVAFTFGALEALKAAAGLKITLEV